MSLLLQEAAANSAKRSKARRAKALSLEPVSQAPAPAGVPIKSPKGESFSLYTIPLEDLPAFLHERGLIVEDNSSLTDKAERLRLGSYLRVKRREDEQEEDS